MNVYFGKLYIYMKNKNLFYYRYRTAKERLRGYFRLSSRRVDKKLQNNECSTENSVTQEITNETCDEPKAMLTEVVAVNNQNMSKINVISDHRTLAKGKKIDGLMTAP